MHPRTCRLHLLRKTPDMQRLQRPITGLKAHEGNQRFLRLSFATRAVWRHHVNFNTALPSIVVGMAAFLVGTSHHSGHFFVVFPRLFSSQRRRRQLSRTFFVMIPSTILIYSTRPLLSHDLPSRSRKIFARVITHHGIRFQKNGQMFVL